MSTTTVQSEHLESLLEVEDLKTWFHTSRGIVRAVDGVSLRVRRDETLAIVGESGSGKSVLGRSIMGLLPRAGTVQTDGKVMFRGTDLRRLPQRELQKLWGPALSMVFQDPMTSLNPVLRIGRQITESLRRHMGMTRADARVRAAELLHSVGIPGSAERLNDYPHQLSGGMRQRVTIAIALACNPDLLIADEPTTALDVTVQAQILELLGHEQRSRKMGMILVSHDLGVVAGRADTVGVMYAGKLVELAPTKRLFSSMKMPYTQALISAVPGLGNAPHTRLIAIPGKPPDLTAPPVGCRFSPRCPYAQERCLVEEPPLQPADSPDHQYACWYPVGTPEGLGALEQNLRRGRTAAGADPSWAKQLLGRHDESTATGPATSRSV